MPIVGGIPHLPLMLERHPEMRRLSFTIACQVTLKPVVARRTFTRRPRPLSKTLRDSHRVAKCCDIRRC